MALNALGTMAKVTARRGSVTEVGERIVTGAQASDMGAAEHLPAGRARAWT
jgi:hypothetical protein